MCTWCPEPRGCFLDRIDYSLYLFSPENKLRRICGYLITRRWFDYCVLFFIATNCITLAMERPNIPSDSVVSRIFCLLAQSVKIGMCCCTFHIPADYFLHITQ